MHRIIYPLGTGVLCFGVFFILVITLILSLITLATCSDVPLPANSLSGIHDQDYVGQGSLWEWDLDDDGSFSANQKALSTDTTPFFSISGTYETFDTGFYRFTVGAETGTCTSPCTGLPAEGDQAFGFGVPGVVLIVKPIGGSNPETLVLPAVGSCPEGQVTLNWVRAGTRDGLNTDLSGSYFWGNATFTVGEAITGAQWTLAGTEQLNQTFATTVDCTNGLISMAGDDGTGLITMTTSGVGIVKSAGGGPKPSSRCLLIFRSMKTR